MNPDDVVMNFSPSSLMLLNVVIGFIMFGIAMDVSVKDFKSVAKHPKPLVIAIIAQLLVLPAVTFGLTFILPVTASMALGMILVACCPPGNVSQVLTHRAGGNVALSVSMTAIANVIYIAVLPLSVAFWGSLHPETRALLQKVELDALQMLLEIVFMVGLPFVAGLALKHFLPHVAAKANKLVRILSLLGLFGFIIGALVGNWSAFVTFIGIIMLVVTVHDAVALAIGYGTGWVGGLASRERKAMTFEVGIRNAGLGLGLTFKFFGGLGGMAVVAGWWGVWDIVMGLVLATIWARRTKHLVAGADSADFEGARA